MRCSQCDMENREGRKFCGQCGSSLDAKCSQCGLANEPGEKFCGDCGASLQKTAPPASEPQPLGAVTGERRHLTILFCDVVGSVTLTSQLDPEDWRATVAAYQRAASEAITRFDGEVVRYVGDGIMAFFGYPVAHDNDAERAVRAGLAILDAITKLNQQQSNRPELSVRIGIDSGPVVVGTGAGQAIDAFGDAANIAARIQSTAEPNTLVVSYATHRLISGLFVVEERGFHQLKGLERPVQLYRVVRPSGMKSLFQAAAAAGGLTPFVGREDELRLLLTRWERAQEGEGQVVTIIGEPGIGKSRLLQEFRPRIAGDPHTWLEGSTAPFFQNTPFYAVVEMLRQSFHWHSSQNNERRLVALEASLAPTGLALGEAVPLIAELLELPVGDKYAALRITAEQKRKRLLAALVAWSIGAAKAQPMILATEDLHWADPSTLEVTQLLVEQAANAPLLLLYTARPEFRASWPMRAHHTQIALNRLSARNARAIVEDVAARAALSEETITTVIERTGGVPLFVEELTRAVLQSGEAKISARDIPATLHDSLMARLDRLGATTKKVAQLGAVIGREFSYELLHKLHQVSEEDLQRALDELADAELLYVRGVAPDASYQFKHALIRDAAYEGLLKSSRRELHLAVARTIDEQFPVIKEAHPEVLAHHWSEAGETEAAISGWQNAGERAVERRAYREAEQRYKEALALLGTQALSSERDTLELKLQMALGMVRTATRGYSSAETKEAYTRARALIERTSGSVSFEILNGLRSAAVTRGELRAALGIADEMLQVARATGSPRALASAHNHQGNTRYYLGDLTGAREHFRLSLENYRPQDFPPTGNLIDPGVAASVWSGANEWFLGFPDRAVHYTSEGIALARRLGDPFNIATALGFATHVPGLRGDFKRLLETAEEAIKVSSESGFPIWNIIARARQAWALARSGRVGGAADRIRVCLAEFDSLKFFLARGLYLCLLSEAEAAAGRIDHAMAEIERALEINPEELTYRPMELTLRGDLRLKTDSSRVNAERAEKDFRDAIDIARKIDARSLELTATSSLARLLRDTGRREEARAMLSAIYNWFTEGFDTLDLREARELLEELSS